MFDQVFRAYLLQFLILKKPNVYKTKLCSEKGFFTAKTLYSNNPLPLLALWFHHYCIIQ